MPKVDIPPIKDCAVPAFTKCHIPRPTLSASALRCMLALAALACLLTSNSGCQLFCRGTNVWSHGVDSVVDHAIPCNCLYCSKLDPTRIGRPGGISGRCCCNPAACCNSGLVYAHRWNSPPPSETPSGLQEVPDLAPMEPGQYFPPGDDVTPLFGPGFESADPPAQASAPPAQESEDAGVVRTHYTRTAEPISTPVPRYGSTQLVPVDVIFGN